MNIAGLLYLFYSIAPIAEKPESGTTGRNANPCRTEVIDNAFCFGDSSYQLRTGKARFFSLTSGRLYYLGSLEARENAIYFSLSDYSAAIAQARVLAQFQRERTCVEEERLSSFISIFKPVILQSQQEQQGIIGQMRSATGLDGRERGVMIRISGKKDFYKLEISADIIIGRSNSVDFKFRKNRFGEVLLHDTCQRITLATIHTHRHDHGLSGSNLPEDESELSDMNNIRLTGIPWLSIGPTVIHMGYVTKYNQLLVVKMRSSDLLMELINVSSMDL